MVHPDDGDLYALAEQLAAARRSLVDHAFRMRSADGDWVWLRARAELVSDPDDGGRHLVGIAVDITEQRGLAEQTATRRRAPARRRRGDLGSFVLWDADNRLVLCNSKFQQLHDLPPDAVASGHGLCGGRWRRAARRIVQPQIMRADAAGRRRAHLRGAARRRPLAADQRAPHQGRRLRLGRHRHHRAEAPRGAAASNPSSS